MQHLNRLCALLALVTTLLGLPAVAAADSGDSGGEKLPVFEPPGPHRFAISASGGKLFWDTPFGSRISSWNVGVGGRYRIVGPLFTSAQFHYSRRRPEAGPLDVANNHLTSFAGVGVGGWIESLLLEARLQGGMLTKIVRLDDNAGTTERTVDFRPAGGAEFGVGVSVFGTAALAFVGGGRLYAPERFDMHVGLRFDWLFVQKRR